MKERKVAVRCHPGEAILDRISEDNGGNVQEISCVALGRPRAVHEVSCVPGRDSKYVSCQTFTCPDGFYAVGVHVADTESGREGLGFSCVAHPNTRLSLAEILASSRTPG
jgi:hypothetical protein